MDPWRIAAGLAVQLAARSEGRPLLIALTGHVRPATGDEYLGSITLS